MGGTEHSIACPHCGKLFALDQTLAAPLVEAARRQFEEEARRRQADFARREALLAEQQARLEHDKAGVDRLVQERVAAEKRALLARAQSDARAALDLELRSLSEQLAARDQTLTSMREAELDLRRKTRVLEEQARAAELRMQRELDDERGKIREAALRESETAHRLQHLEKEKTIADLKRSLEEARRRAEAGSEQLRGEIQELDLEGVLRQAFPHDQIEPVPKGHFGGDCLQRVHTASGQPGGCILWETKRTKAFSDGWLEKLRGDMRAAHAEVAVLMTQALPREIERFGLVDGVWVTDPACALPLAAALRHSLLQVAATRLTFAGQRTKMEMLYQYLCGSQFRQRIEAVVEAFTAMQRDLATEKRLLQRQWAQREKQIERLMDSTAGLHGDLGGILGQALPEVSGLELPAPEAEPDPQALPPE